jgi:hypothetical protein
MFRASVASLVAVTPEAERALCGVREVQVTHFPFKVGREYRVADSDPARPLGLQQRLGVAPQVNDMYLAEPPYADIFYISREHFTIERVGDRFFLTDRGSACGTIVAGKQVGGNRVGGRTELRSGDDIVLGTYETGYVFRFEVSRE